MSTPPDLPGQRHTDPGHDAEVMFDELAARAGAALRRPAPADGVRNIVVRRRRQQAGKAIVAGGIALATLAGALVLGSNRRGDLQTPADSTPNTHTTATVDSPPETTLGSVPETPPASTPAAPGTTVNALARVNAVEAFLSAVDDDRSCTHLECSFDVYLYPRWELIQLRAAWIRGDDVAEYRDAISETWKALTDCVEGATRATQECAAQQDEFKARFLELYDALHAPAPQGDGG